MENQAANPAIELFRQAYHTLHKTLPFNEIEHAKAKGRAIGMYEMLEAMGLKAEADKVMADHNEAYNY